MRFRTGIYLFIAVFFCSGSQLAAQEQVCGDFLKKEFFVSAATETVTECIENGRSVDERTDEGNTPLHLAAAFASDAAVTRALLQAGADPNVKNLKNYTPMHKAALHTTDAAQIVTLAIWDAEADKGATSDTCWRGRCVTTPLHLAARRPEAVNVTAALLAVGVPTDTYAGKDLKGDEYLLPLHLAARHANIEAVSILLQAGADVNHADHDRGRTALHYAASRKNESFQIIQTLLRAGASADATDERDVTPLMLAAAYTRDPKVFAVLLDAAESPCLGNENNSTALKMHDQNDALEPDDSYWMLHAVCTK